MKRRFRQLRGAVASAQTASVNRVSKPKTRANLGPMRLKRLSVVHYIKARGANRTKVFKLKTLNLAPHET